MILNRERLKISIILQTTLRGCDSAIQCTDICRVTSCIIIIIIIISLYYYYEKSRKSKNNQISTAMVNAQN